MTHRKTEIWQILNEFPEKEEILKIATASDHAGYELKTGVMAYLSEIGIEYKDFGCGPGEKVDYVDYGEKAVKSVLSGECDRLILFCGTGLGMAIVANKHRGIRATPCFDEYTAEVSRSHNDSNCLTLGGRVLPLDEALSIVKVWINTNFEGGRHQKRIQKIINLEEMNFKQ